MQWYGFIHGKTSHLIFLGKKRKHLFFVCGTENRTQGIAHAREALYYWIASPVLIKQFLRQDLTKLLILASNLQWSCFNLLSGWDYRYMIPCPTRKFFWLWVRFLAETHAYITLVHFLLFSVAFSRELIYRVYFLLQDDNTNIPLKAFL